MPQIATFIDTTLPNFVGAARALVADGWKKVPNTAGNRRTILFKYYEYLVNTNAKMAGLNVRMIRPEQLQSAWEKAAAEYGKYEMYVKSQVAVAPGAGMNLEADAPPPVEEAFASVNDVERMQPGYVDIDDLLAGFGRMGLGGGKRGKRHMKSQKRVKTHKRKTHKRRHTRRR